MKKRVMVRTCSVANRCLFERESRAAATGACHLARKEALRGGENIMCADIAQKTPSARQNAIGVPTSALRAAAAALILWRYHFKASDAPAATFRLLSPLSTPPLNARRFHWLTRTPPPACCRDEDAAAFARKSDGRCVRAVRRPRTLPRSRAVTARVIDASVRVAEYWREAMPMLLFCLPMPQRLYDADTLP